MDGIRQMPNFEPMFRLLIGMVKQRGPQRGLTWGNSALTSNANMCNHESAADLKHELEIRLRQSLDEGTIPELEALAASLGIERQARI
jgi:hypothetical protein